MKQSQFPFFALLLALLFSCTNNNNNQEEEQNCTTDQALNTERGACTETLSFSSEYQEMKTPSKRVITSNNIPNHMVGVFGSGMGSLNPNEIAQQNASYSIPLNPSMSNSLTPLLSTAANGGPKYSFGIVLNGVELDPIAAEPFPHQGVMNPNVNWEWNLEATNVRIGLDCNNAHVQPNGKYHYHGAPILFLQKLNIPTTQMTLIGYAADGFPIYYKYAYTTASDSSSSVIEMTSSYRLKSGNRPGDGVTAPCDVYNGIYSNDYEYVENLGTLDEANGRNGVTPEYPSGTYYYVITDNFPSIPRYFRGTPSDTFKIGQ